MSSPREESISKPLLIIKAGSTFAGIRQAHGDFEDWFVQRIQPLGLTCLVIEPPAGGVLPDQSEVAGVLVTGSPAMVSDREDWSELTAAWLKAAVEGGLPVLGVCYGHQLLAHALGGKVDYHPQGREIGTWPVTLHEEAADDRLFQAMPREFKVHLTHAQSVVELPNGAQLLASTEFEACQAFRVGNQAWGVQFHPEFNGEIMREYITTFAPQLREEGKNPEELLAAVDETPLAQNLLERFAALAMEHS